MLKLLRRDEKGFTLVELMMVIVILGVLAGVAVPMIGGMRQRAITAKLNSTIDAVGTAILLKAATVGSLPAEGTESVPFNENEIEIEISLPDDIKVYKYDKPSSSDWPRDTNYVIIYEVDEGKGNVFTLSAVDKDTDKASAIATRTFTFSF